ncbi:MAG: hypothetical protein NE328_07435 [Lentisphaeraceae bacterium]|nr:hypothetical protein [Lentisphaeraceae bacterium]
MLFKYLLIFLLIIIPVTISAQYTDLEEIIQNNPFNITEAVFKEKWAKKYDMNWYGNRIGAEKRLAKIFGFKAASVKFKFSSGKLDLIELDFASSGFDYMSYNYWSKKNHSILNELTAKYGKAQSSEIRGDLSIKFIWKTKDINVLFLTKAIDSSNSNTNYSKITFYKKKTLYSLASEKYTIPGDVLYSTKAKLFSQFNHILPSPKEISEVASKLKKLNPPKILINNSHKVYFGHQNVIRNFDVNPLDIFDSSVFRYTFKRATPISKYSHVKIITKNSKVISLQNIFIENPKENKEEIVLRTNYLYDKENALKVIHAENGTNVFQVWIDYDSNGFVSRVLKFEDLILKNVYFVHTLDQYNNYIALEYFYPNEEFRNFKIKSDDLSLKYTYNTHYGQHSYYTSTEKPSQIISQTEEFLKYQLTPIIPNIAKKSEYIPNNPIDSSFLKPVLNIYKKSIALSKEHNKKIQKSAPLILSAEGNPFNKMDLSLTYKIGEENETLPFIVNKVAKNAIQVKTTTNKLVTIFKDKIVLNKLQLIKILDSGAEFKDIKTQKIHTLKIGQPYALEKKIIITYKNSTHLLSNNDKFMGFQVLIENDEMAFSRQGRLYRQKEFYIDLPNLIETEGSHKIENCTCYTPDFDQPSKELKPQEITKAKSDKIDPSYIFKFCDFDLFEQITNQTGFNSWSYRYKRLGIYKKSNGNLIPVRLNDSNHDYEFTFKSGKFSVSGKRISLYKDVFERQTYYADLGKTAVGFSLIPNNPWTLERLINTFSLSVKREGIAYNYHFSDKTCRINGKDVPFKFSILPEKYQIIIDNITYNLIFKNSTVIAKPEDMTRGFSFSQNKASFRKEP